MRPNTTIRHPLLILLAVALVSVLFVVSCGGGATATAVPGSGPLLPSSPLPRPPLTPRGWLRSPISAPLPRPSRPRPLPRPSPPLPPLPLPWRAGQNTEEA